MTVTTEPPRSAFRVPRSAILLLGPTGSGKSPLGDYLEQHGLAGRRCVHFDFGANMRAVDADAGDDDTLNDDDREVLRRVLSTNALLEDSEFHIAAKILRAFLVKQALEENDFIVLNGLPRHIGQTRDVESLVNIAMVVYLNCSASVVRERIRRNTGGDRDGRADDSAREVDRKIEIFKGRTAPLLEHYREQGKLVVDLDVGVMTDPADLVTQIEAASGAAAID